VLFVGLTAMVATVWWLKAGWLDPTTMVVLGCYLAESRKQHGGGGRVVGGLRLDPTTTLLDISGSNSWVLGAMATRVHVRGMSPCFTPRERRQIQRRWFLRQWCPRDGGGLGVQRSDSASYGLMSDRLVLTGRQHMKVV
jgi:hypothetical protein